MPASSWWSSVLKLHYIICNKEVLWYIHVCLADYYTVTLRRIFSVPGLVDSVAWYHDVAATAGDAESTNS
jgi:hypothetical protein